MCLTLPKNESYTEDFGASMDQYTPGWFARRYTMFCCTVLYCDVRERATEHNCNPFVCLFILNLTPSIAPKFDRRKHNWFAMSPVDSSGAFEFADYSDRNFSLSVIKMSLSNRALVWVGDSMTRG